MRAYHDEEWGRPSHDDAHLFEMLVLEGAQAGLSWAIILSKRDGYRRALDGFDYQRIAGYDDDRLGDLLLDPGIIRNRLKIRSTVGNAQAFVATRAEFGTFADYLWAWVDGTPVINNPRQPEEIATRSDLSDRLSKDLKTRGFRFVGTTIVYSYLQSVGLVNDHVVGCPAKYRPQPST
jgi:DNA-3-methyladenine glycosylase I